MNLFRRIINYIFRRKVKKEHGVKISRLPVFYNQKHYTDMTRREKREYKRWLAKHDMWDAEVVLENLDKN